MTILQNALTRLDLAPIFLDAMLSDSEEQRAPLARNLRAFRKSLSLTQQYVEAATGIPQAYISKWEKGVAPDLPRLLDLLAFYGRTIEEAVEGISSSYQRSRAVQRNAESKGDGTSDKRTLHIGDSSGTIPAPRADARGGADDGRTRRSRRSVADLRADLKRQIEEFAARSDAAQHVIDEMVGLAKQPGVLDGPPLARTARTSRSRPHQE